MSKEVGNQMGVGKMSIPQILKMVAPTVIMAVFAGLYGIVDGIFVSNKGGPAAFAAVNLVTPIFLIMSSFGMMFGTGGNALVSKTRGEGNEEEAKKIFSTLSFAVIILGIVLTILLEFFLDDVLALLGAKDEMLHFCLDYSRILIPFIVFYLLQYYFQSMLVTAGKGMMGFAMTVAAGLTNIVGDVILVGFVAQDAHQAVAGASIATCLGLLVGGLIPLIYFMRKNSSCLRIVKTGLDIKVILKTCSNGISEFFSNISGAIMNTVFNGLLLYIVGQKGVAAYGSISYVNLVFCAMFMGYSIGVSPAISYKYGAGDKEGLKSIHKNSMIIIVVASVAMLALSELIAEPVSAIFSSGQADLLALTVTGFRIYAVSFLYKGLNTYASAFFTALNNGFVSGFLAITRSLVFSIGAVLVLPIVYFYMYGEEKALLGIWWSTNYAEFLALVVAVIFVLANRKKYQY